MPRLASLIFSVAITTTGLLFLSGCGKDTHPTDAVLLENFAKHEAEFEQLLAMLRTDRTLERVDDNWTRPADPMTIGVTPERIAEYRQRFATLGIPRGFYAFHDPERFSLLATAFGLSVGGSAKGYAYLEHSPDLIIGDLDTYHSDDGRSFTAYRHIHGHWYLFFEYEN